MTNRRQAAVQCFPTTRAISLSDGTTLSSVNLRDAGMLDYTTYRGATLRAVGNVY